MTWKVATVIATVAALAATLYAVHTAGKLARILPPPRPPVGDRSAADEQTALAALVVKKGAKAVAEASKEAQLGDVRAHDRKASKATRQGG